MRHIRSRGSGAAVTSQPAVASRATDRSTAWRHDRGKAPTGRGAGVVHLEQRFVPSIVLAVAVRGP